VVIRPPVGRIILLSLFLTVPTPPHPGLFRLAPLGPRTSPVCSFSSFNAQAVTGPIDRAVGLLPFRVYPAPQRVTLFRPLNYFGVTSRRPLPSWSYFHFLPSGSFVVPGRLLSTPPSLRSSRGASFSLPPARCAVRNPVFPPLPRVPITLPCFPFPPPPGRLRRPTTSVQFSTLHRSCIPFRRVSPPSGL